MPRYVEFALLVDDPNDTNQHWFGFTRSDIKWAKNNKFTTASRRERLFWLGSLIFNTDIDKFEYRAEDTWIPLRKDYKVTTKMYRQKTEADKNNVGTVYRFEWSES